MVSIVTTVIMVIGITIFVVVTAVSMLTTKTIVTISSAAIIVVNQCYYCKHFNRCKSIVTIIAAVTRLFLHIKVTKYKYKYLEIHVLLSKYISYCKY